MSMRIRQIYEDACPPNMEVCQCCERIVARIHWMEWGGDLSWLCDECADQALEEDEPTAAGVPVRGEEG